MKYQEVKVTTNDGKATLNAWEFKGKSGKWVLMSHNGEGNMGDYLRKVDMFVNLGFSVVFFDYRGYGESSEFEIDNNMYIYPHFQDDVRSMIDYCRKTHSETFAMYGWGIGAGLSLGIGYTRSEITHIIADTPFLSMEDLEDRFEDAEEPMEVPFAGMEHSSQPFHALQETPGKYLKGILLIIGSNDILYKPADMMKLREQAFKLSQPVYIVENPDRKDNFRMDKEAYMGRIQSLLAKQ